MAEICQRYGRFIRSSHFSPPAAQLLLVADELPDGAGPSDDRP